ncbi:hypothetical protein [Pseudomonas izuensis]|uniref:hypothetical protein n=1 Tax=Pseudomonas izuensis TaxID=2684212 RepID=UPI00135A2971|nr:hypothetical protein [Pseudomonas izuensis]
MLEVARNCKSIQVLITRSLSFGSACMMLASPSYAGSPNELLTFVPEAEQVEMQKKEAKELEILRSTPANEEVRFVGVNTALIAPDTKELVVKVADNKNVSYRLIASKELENGISSWEGQIDSDRHVQYPSKEEVDVDPLNSALILRKGDEVAGSLWVAGDEYSLRTLKDKTYIFVKIDESKVPPDEPLSASNQLPADVEVTSPKTPYSVIDVLVVASSAFEPSIDLLDAMLMVQKANSANRNSGVDVIFRLSDFKTINYSPMMHGLSMSKVLGKMRDKDDPNLGSIIAPLRDASRSDLVMYAAWFPPDVLCGRAWLNSRVDTAFSVVDSKCFSGITPVHEMGHNIGVDHSYDWRNPSNPTYMNGHHQGKLFRTIMNQDEAHETLMLWSTPSKAYKGFPLGNVGTANAVRRINERREVISNFYP